MDIQASLHGKRVGLSKDGDLVLDRDGTQRIVPVTRIVNVTDSTLTVSKDSHEGRTVTLNRAAGITVTLPAATGSGDKYRFFTGTTVTSNANVIQVTGNDIMVGQAQFAQDGGDTVVVFDTAADTDTISGNGSTTGGIKGEVVELEDVAADTWAVFVRGSATGSEATPFSAAV